ncbi:MAG: aminomethyl-transferring glycine dehydrogenase subunit GcvPB [Chloroflexota bacterium]|jgi:glycine dehydrogenase subunit 2|nr:aminomethyl-transferring glycine dehydrogenase subunit GcvPB [Chloroflexota bacterium]MDP6509097.1 aminomethyl-transferring glycine dehydrogenase subunit GcvPB [Chloroflexota bacterium]MDP6758269.1 aminomethyl-transferring glycine dehydrogenase subunit GcvPB [Chloroflexota bacterium]
MTTQPPIYELSSPGRVGVDLPALPEDGRELADLLPATELRDDLPLPEVSQIDVVRHYVRLSQKNFSIDTDMYPLGSCTMKYNPKVNELTGRLPGLAAVHPLQADEQVQGCLELLSGLEEMIGEIAGFPAVSLQPAAGAQGEFVGMMLIRAQQLRREDVRMKVLIPASAHGTNPATASMCGYESVSIPNGPDGEVDIEAVRAAMGPDVAAVMMTVPNTLGLFESRIQEVCDLAHAAGALVYCDGANMNAMLGRVRPGNLGIDVMHLNLHKTFSTPHGGGGPGAGALCASAELDPYLPVPRVVEGPDGGFARSSDFPHSIGRIQGHMGNFGNLVRAYTYIRSLGAEGLREIADIAVLNANYLRVKLQDVYDLPHDRICMHEVVFSGRRQKAHGVRTLDIAKRLIDFGFHPPTVYFPLIVEEALMIEPTETESRETLDRFIAAMRTIAAEVETDPQRSLDAPLSTPVGRLDEATAARKPDLRYVPPA